MLPAYLEPGPCTPAPPITGQAVVPLKTEKGVNTTLELKLTLPSACAAGRGRQAPWFVVMFYSGWTVRLWGKGSWARMAMT